jgi:hypothetical protein
MDNKEYRKNYYIQNKEHRKIKDKEYYLKNQEDRKRKSLEYYNNNTEKVSEYKKTSQKVKIYSKTYYLDNKETRKKYTKVYNQKPEVKLRVNEVMKIKKENSLEFRLISNLRSRLANAVQNRIKNPTITELGCSIKDFKKYLEKQFDENMTWENYGEYWEIDHIFPLSKGGSFHYTNTQPLTINENRSKKDKIL